MKTICAKGNYESERFIRKITNLYQTSRFSIAVRSSGLMSLRII